MKVWTENAIMAEYCVIIKTGLLLSMYSLVGVRVYSSDIYLMLFNVMIMSYYSLAGVWADIYADMW